MCMIDDSEGWRVYREQWRNAAKDHTCCECRRTIGTGERYLYVTGLPYDYDHWQSYRMCEQCRAAAEWLLAVCSGWLYGAVAEDLFEHVGGEEFYLRSAPLTRLVRWQRAQWRNRAGVLRPAEDVRAVVGRAIDAYRKRESLNWPAA